MKSLILLSGKLTANIDNYDLIYNLNYFENNNYPNFYDIEIKDFDKEISAKIENSLFNNFYDKKNEIILDSLLLNFQEVLFRFLIYYQFKVRLLKIIKNYKLSKIFVSSYIDEDYLHCLIHITKKNNIELILLKDLEYKSLKYDLNETPLDLPIKFNKSIFSFFFNNYCKIFGRKNLYFSDSRFGENIEQINYLSNLKYHSFSLSHLNLTFISIFRQLFSFKNLTYLNSDYKLNTDIDIVIDLKNWSNFDEDECLYINKILYSFRKIYDDNYLKTATNTILNFLKKSQIKKIILSSDLNPSSILLTYLCNKNKIDIYFLPHGIIMEDTRLTNKLFNAQRLSWNINMHNYIKNLNQKSVLFTHPFLLRKTSKSKSINYKKNRKLLILCSDHVNFSSVYNPDIRYQDLIQAVQSSHKILTDYEINVKIHPMPDYNFKIQRDIFENIRNKYALNFSLLENNINFDEQLMLKYSLIIIGNTTAIIDCCTQKVPFIIFNAKLKKFSIFNNFNLPNAETRKELETYLYDFKKEKIKYSTKEFVNSFNNIKNFNNLT